MAKTKWYAVTVGKDVGVFTTWLEVAPLVKGVSEAIHQSFTTEEEAQRAFNEEKKKGTVRIVGQDSSNVNSPNILSTASSSPNIPGRQIRVGRLNVPTSPPHSPTKSLTTRPSSREVPTERSPAKVTHALIKKPAEPRRSHRVKVEVLSDGESYPSDCESSLTSPLRAATLLSPLDSPKLFRQEPIDVEVTNQHSPKHSSRSSYSSRGYASASSSKTPSRTSSRTSVHRDHHAPTQPMSPPRTNNSSQRRYACPNCTCPNCNNNSAAAAEKEMPFGSRRPRHISNLGHEILSDPRSPMRQSTSVSASGNAISFGRPSPNVTVENEMSALFMRL